MKEGGNIKWNFTTWDFVVFIISLILSIAIGIYYSIKNRRSETTENYYFGNRNIMPIPLGISMAVSVISGITMIGIPVEVYLYGVVTAWIAFGNLSAYLFAAVYYVPLIHRLQLTSVFQFLEMRFNKAISLVCSSITTVLMIIYMGLSLYIPSLALNAATPLGLGASIAIIGVVCIVYTTFGGIRAVVYTDTLQAVIMTMGSLLLLIKGTNAVGGSGAVMEAVQNGGRMNLFKLTADPRIRSAMLAIMIGQSFIQTSATCSNQSLPQRLLSCKSVGKARIALLSFLVTSTIIFLLAVANGCVLYAYFENCDPISSGEVSKKDQAPLYMMMRLFRDIPGAAGLFVAAIFSGTLSTISTGINSLSAVLLHDYLLSWKPNMKMQYRMIISWSFVTGLALLVMAIAYGTSAIGTTTVRVANTALGALGGPIFGVFLLGMFVPWTSSFGALIGLLMGGAFSIWLAIGAMMYPPTQEMAQKLPLSTIDCEVPFVNSTSFESTTFSTELTAAGNRPAIADGFYSISFFWFGMIGCLATVILAIIASFILGAEDPALANPNYFVPFVSNKRFPETFQKFFRFGVPAIKQKKSILEDRKDKYLQQET